MHTISPKPAYWPPLCRRDIHKVDRPPLHLAIYERLLTGGHRTNDPSKADFFYVPITSRCSQEGPTPCCLGTSPPYIEDLIQGPLSTWEAVPRPFLVFDSSTLHPLTPSHITVYLT